MRNVADMNMATALHMFRKMLLTGGVRFGVFKCAKRVFGIALTLYTSYVAVQWIRYGRSSRRNRTEGKDDLLDRFMPNWDVAEIHNIFLECEPADGYRLACNLDPMQLPLVRFIFRTRRLMLRGSEQTPVQTGGLVPYTKSIGWAALAEIPEREILMGSVTKPWEANVKFHSLRAEEFIAFREPDYVKIVWTLRVDATPSGTLFLTQTRAVATDTGARRKFRMYWAVFSPGIVLIRRFLLFQVRREAKSRKLRRIPGPVMTR